MSDNVPTPSFINIALIRGINVGGNSIVSMGDLRKVFEELGFFEVSTYIQSGNVIFSAELSDKDRLAAMISEKLTARMGKKFDVFVLDKNQLEEASKNNPFRPQDPEKQVSHIVFLSGEPEKEKVAALKELEGRECKFEVKGEVLYFSYLREDAANRRTIDFERVLGVRATARTWRAVDKLIELVG